MSNPIAVHPIFQVRTTAQFARMAATGRATAIDLALFQAGLKAHSVYDPALYRALQNGNLRRVAQLLSDPWRVQRLAQARMHLGNVSMFESGETLTARLKGIVVSDPRPASVVQQPVAVEVGGRLQLAGKRSRPKVSLAASAERSLRNLEREALTLERAGKQEAAAKFFFEIAETYTKQGQYLKAAPYYLRAAQLFFEDDSFPQSFVALAFARYNLSLAVSADPAKVSAAREELENMVQKNIATFVDGINERRVEWPEVEEKSVHVITVGAQGLRETGAGAVLPHYHYLFATFLLALHRYDQAYEEVIKATDLFGANQDWRSMGDAEALLAKIETHREENPKVRIERVVTHYHVAAVYYSRAKDFRRAAEIYRFAGSTCYDAERFIDALLYFGLMKRYAQKIPDKNMAFQATQLREVALAKSGELEKAVKNLVRLAGRKKREGDKEGAIDIYQLIAKLYREVNSFALEAGFYNLAASLALEEGIVPGAITYYGLASLALQKLRDQPEQQELAREYWAEAVAIAQRDRGEAGEALLHYLIGCYFRECGEKGVAAEMFLKTVMEYEAHGYDPSPDEGITLGELYENLGDCYCDLGRTDLAVSAFDKAFQSYLQHGDEEGMQRVRVKKTLALSTKN